MKKIFYFILAIVTVSCSDTTTEDISRVTNYPVITLNGESLMILNQGDTYTEVGGTALEGETEIDLTLKGTVNTAVPNVYKIIYSAINVDGFPASKTRTVVVLSTTPSAINLEGTFARGSNINNITRLADRKYMCDNAAGYTTGDENNLKMIFYNVDDTKIYAPYQENASDTDISAESNVGTIEDEDNFNWIIYASSFYGTATRIFTRQ